MLLTGLDEMLAALEQTRSCVQTDQKVFTAYAELLRTVLANVVAALEVSSTRGQDHINVVEKICRWACHKQKSSKVTVSR